MRRFPASRESAGDLSSRTYLQTRASLQRIQKTLPEARFAYLLELRDGKVIFLAGLEPAESQDHSLPGEVYSEASDVMRGVFATKAAATEGPLAIAGAFGFPVSRR